MTQRYGYGGPETGIPRLNQWIGLHGGEDSMTLLMYEAHKALSKLRTPVDDADELSFEAQEHGHNRRYEQGFAAGWRQCATIAPVASAEVMDSLDGIDDFIARCNRDDRGSCDSVNVLRRALASTPCSRGGGLHA